MVLMSINKMNNINLKNNEGKSLLNLADNLGNKEIIKNIDKDELFLNRAIRLIEFKIL